MTQLQYSPFLTKSEAIERFKDIYRDDLRGNFKTDKPAKRQAWNDFVDSLQKDGYISPTADWTQPKFIQS